jgi:hypothetical protein
LTARQGLAILIRTVRIRYSRAPAILFLVGGAVIVFMACTKFVLGRWSIPDLCLDLVELVIVGSFAISLLVRPLGELTDTELTVRAVFGRRDSRYPADQLRVVKRGLYCGDKAILGRWATNRDDWRALVERVQARGG